MRSSRPAAQAPPPGDLRAAPPASACRAARRCAGSSPDISPWISKKAGKNGRPAGVRRVLKHDMAAHAVLLMSYVLDDVMPDLRAGLWMYICFLLHICRI